MKNCLGLLAYRKHLFIPAENFTATVQCSNFAWGKKQRLNIAVIKSTGTAVPPWACWPQLKSLLTYQILYLKREILALYCYFLSPYVGYDAIFRFMSLLQESFVLDLSSYEYL